MNNERKSVMCRCGREMSIGMVEDEYWHPTRNGPDSGGRHRWRYECVCGWLSPVEDTIEAAYFAATRTPPNLPLTREQMEAMQDSTAIWYIHRYDYDHSLVRLRTASYVLTEHPACLGYDWAQKNIIYFAYPPTSADIEAARKEKEE